MQLRELREYCKQRLWTITCEYVDTDWGNGRPEFDRLMCGAGQHRFDLVLVWRLDRFGRSVRHSIQNLRSLGSWDFDRKKAIAMRRRGVSLRTIAGELGVSKSAVERLVRAETGGPNR